MKCSQFLWSVVLIISLSACSSGPKRKLDPAKAAQANVELGFAYFQEGEMELAMQYLQKALSQDPDLPMAHSAIAVVYERLGEVQQAERHYSRAISLNPKDSKINNNYGQFLCQQNRLEEAEKQFMKAVGNPLYSAPESAYTNAGICARRIPDEKKAEEYFRKALEKNPLYPMALLQMLKLSYDQKEYLRGRAYLQRFQQVSRHTPESLWYAIRVEHALGDKDAVSSYGLLLSNGFPDSLQTREYLDWKHEQY